MHFNAWEVSSGRTSHQNQHCHNLHESCSDSSHLSTDQNSTCIMMTTTTTKTNTTKYVVLLFLCCAAAAAAAFFLANDTSRFSLDEDATISTNGFFVEGVARRLNILDDGEVLPPLFPLRASDYVGFGVAIVGLLLAAGGGIGGGGILVPTYILLLNFPVKHAIPLASTTVVGGAIANNILNAPKSHPLYPNRSIIDWDLILQLEPMTILGALVGAFLNDYLPDILLVILMVLLLTVTATKTLQKAHSMYQKESEELAKKHSDELRGLLNGKNPSLTVAQGYDSTTSGTTPSSENSSAAALDQSQTHRQTVLDATKLTCLFGIVTLLNLLKGGPGEGGGPVGVEECGMGCYWMSQIAIVVVIVAFSWNTRRNILSRQKEHTVTLSDIEWDEDNTIRYPLYAIVAGLVAGLFGVGGGIIKGPLMLALGVHPAVASATSACMILYTSITATSTYMIFGFLVYDYALFCLVLGVVATWLGQTVMTVLMKDSERHSYIAFSIGGVVGLSAIAMGIESILALTA